MFVEFFQTEKEFDVLQVYDGNHGLYLLHIQKFSSATLVILADCQCKWLLLMFYFILQLFLEVWTSSLSTYHVKTVVILLFYKL